MRDIIAEEILRNEIQRPNLRNDISDRIERMDFPSYRDSYREPRPRPTPTRIPPANRYPHSMARAELERARSPWNRSYL